MNVLRVTLKIAYTNSVFKNAKGEIFLKSQNMAVEKNYNYKERSLFTRLLGNIREHYYLYILSLPALVLHLVFVYYPIYGVQIAFKDFNSSLGILGSHWVGFEHFIRFFNSNQFWILLTNTFRISIYSIIAGFPIPILLAFMLNDVKNKYFKKTVQMVTYAPHFISVVVLVGMLLIFLESPNGLINKVVGIFGASPTDFIAKPEFFDDIYVWSAIWQGAGWASIIYISSLAGIDPQLHEAAIIDGATKFQRIRHVDFPGILPVISIQFILVSGSILGVGFEKVYLMQNQLNLISSEVISTYVYKVGIIGAEFSFSSAVGLFNSLINFVMLVFVNTAVRKMGGTSLW